MKSTIFLKLLLGFLVVILIATVLVDVLVTRRWAQSYADQVTLGLEQKSRLIGEHARNLPEVELPRVARGAAQQADARVTLISRDGRVLADSEADASRMENHASRPEVSEALRGRTGRSTRWSHTVRTDFLYVAVPGGPGVVRLAYPLTELEHSRARIRWRIWGASASAAAIALLLAAFLSWRYSGRIGRLLRFSEAIAGGDLSARAHVSGGDEVSLLATALNATAVRLEDSFHALESSRRELTAVLDGMEEGVIAVDSDKTVVWANRSMERILSLDRPITPGGPLVDLVREPEVQSAVDAVLRQGRPVSARMTLAARERFLKISCAPMLDGAGAVTGAVAVFHDDTQVERLERVRKDFVANVSHELRTPLTSIRGYTETLLDGVVEDPGKRRDCLEVIRTHAARMERITADLLTLSQWEAGRYEFRLSSLDAVWLLDSAVETVRVTAEAKGLHLLAQRPAAALRVQADEEALHRVLLNLLDNAIKYTPPGGEVSAGAVERQGEALFFVRDTGIGIGMEHQPRIFERFYRVDKARSREAGGTGLGLAIARHIVRAHGGEIRVESELGHGSCFSFSVAAENNVPWPALPAPMAPT